jgi:hypothetical protein
MTDNVLAACTRAYEDQQIFTGQETSENELTSPATFL